MRSTQKKRLRLWIRGAVILLCVSTALPSVAEQHESPSQFWMNDSPVGAGPHAVRAHARPTSRQTARQADTRGASPAPSAKPKPNFVVAVFGDAFGAQLARGLADAFATSPATLIDDQTNDGSELTALEPGLWATRVESVQTRNRRLDAALILLGGDDVQPLTNAQGAPEAPGSAAWRQLYGDRVEKLAALFRDRHIPLIWVGLPIVRDDDEAKGFADLNAVIRERATQGGATFVDSWEAFADDNGQYTATGPDVNGQTATLRRSDGWDFTRAGARKLASFVEASLKPARDRAESSSQLASVPNANPDAFDQALSIDINAQIRREAGLSLENPSQGSLAAPSPPVAPRKAGPVLSLNAPPLAIGGKLAAVSQPESVQPPWTSEPGSRRGRSDDFSWPSNH